MSLTRNQRITWLYKPLMFLICLLPLAVLLMRGASGDLGPNPVEAVTHSTGTWAFRILLASLCISPLVFYLRLRIFQLFRRMLGLFAFFYACLHFLIYIGIDHGFDLGLIKEDVLERKFMTAGFAAFVLMIPLALTSTNGMIRRLGSKRWQLLHRLVYVAAVLVAIHYIWLVKSDLRSPLIYATVCVFLLVLRMPGVKNFYRRFRR